MPADAIIDSRPLPEGEGKGKGSTNPPDPDRITGDEARLLEDYLDANFSPLSLCRIHGLTVPQLEAWANSPRIRARLDAIARISADRAAAIAAHARVKAIAALEFLTGSDADETARRAATTLMRAKQPISKATKQQMDAPRGTSTHPPSGPLPCGPVAMWPCGSLPVDLCASAPPR